ncbi:MAG TPA: PD-(D/E)XK nuclease family protein [Candidatus Nanoarchaeia archaeon]|nr:PD-(D/E)XK nuclease family protein [Candidatus Nanoarchaeia archaeon]
MARIESASSITTYNTCPRKYYYSYKLELPKKDSISTLTGKAVHEALEKFFQIDVNSITKENYKRELKQRLLVLFNESWINFLDDLNKLEVEKEVIRDYYQESMSMLNNFVEDFINSISNELSASSFLDAFNKLKPMTEVYLFSEKHNVRGYLDAVMNVNDDIFIIDYKTSSRDKITDDYRLQLTIYALMYNEKFNKLPKKVGLHFLRHGTKKFIDISKELLKEAVRQCELIQVKTASENINDYPKNPGYYCKWKDGECSFYNVCFGAKKLDNFIEIKGVKSG